ncbi:SWIM zinc finger family protein [Nocardia blacklockiae]|uniref:SWIM zinc finger family protein n=1 Tax=Nocardia blacklockiae TaxID=480036 RepID=UPI0018944FBD|nr:SWIM zinc finger family protein [Nocardia blacklockiae]MBF6175096.1 SWIM zinc finger family protein [Nocardia blacklockiae]
MPDSDFGYTAWGRDWVRLAEPLTVTRPEPLLPRARRIARNDSVRLEIEGRTVRAAIHRGAQASVTHLELAPLPAAVRTAIAAHLPPDAGELADTVHADLRAAGIPVAPRILNSDCSCSARNPRCLHLLATCYALALRIDENPWLALDLQGYRESSPTSTDPDTPPPRWTPLDTLDPATFFSPTGNPIPLTNTR